MDHPLAPRVNPPPVLGRTEPVPLSGAAATPPLSDPLRKRHPGNRRGELRCMSWEGPLGNLSITTCGRSSIRSGSSMMRGQDCRLRSWKNHRGGIAMPSGRLLDNLVADLKRMPSGHSTDRVVSRRCRRPTLTDGGRPTASWSRLWPRCGRCSTAPSNLAAGCPGPLFAQAISASAGDRARWRWVRHGTSSSVSASPSDSGPPSAPARRGLSSIGAGNRNKDPTLVSM